MRTDLENACLGVLWLHQPCTAYAVRKVFEQSLSSHWSGTGGTVYPLLKRLTQQGLVKSAARKGDGRATRIYQLTKSGTRELVTWLRPPLPEAAGLMTFDPIRVRLRFLAVLSKEDRQSFLDEARQKLEDHLALALSMARDDKRKGDTFRYLSNRGGILAIRAQLAWLTEVEDNLNRS